ncbi:cyclic di-GMP phosphodiesterase [Erwinia pyrifoliae]|uniref:cyclic di-GMP phosphodiesterase n=1 Tax=Erwinia pyrifoliae TaxID=79967 RepID=UPI0001960B04|nr:cyclic di-GMP phosphodiesterase [Erwinia pyrifoliae]AUX73149.1 phage resistance protein [Erwinia pyrifoliae]MCA8876568.1 cyclic di-GMP phosphodiesterase [Erwinia pyrifoliae]UXK11092.1 cyclic di-GMP phosphodiesterase [Erwinia pyrifoliae]CAX55109.1 Rtn protein [Erwinia pyrifoliae Ep1/96]CAY73799.1 Protein rtn [Erwinia pyrifoliae DSM 12163]
MPLSTTVRRHVIQPRRVTFLSMSIGFIVFLLFICCSIAVTSHKRSEDHDRLVNYSKNYLIRVMRELQQTLLPLQAETNANCDRVRDNLAERAALTSNIRAILLVNHNNVVCSSATGTMSMDIHKISPYTNANESTDTHLISATPMQKDKPAMVLWLKNAALPGSGILTTLNINMAPYLLLTSRQHENSGVAIVTGDTAITTWNEQVVNARALPPDPLRRVVIPGYPMTLYLYGETLPNRDLHIIVLSGLLIGIIIACGCYLLFALRSRHGKEILQGIKRGEFHVEYQPIIAAHSAKPYGLEALLRWTHPTEGPIPADAFISYAEGQNLIVPLTRHLFTLIAQDAQSLRHVVPAGTQLGLNLSPNHLTSPGFCKDVHEWLAMMPVDHFEYIFEITERTMVSDSNANEMFDWIREQNIKIAIDDFGTGHSALLYLEKFHFDYLKIDRGFVQSVGIKTVTSQVLDTVLALAKKLNLKTVAEGVETKEQALWLIDRGVTHLQGYLYSRPLTVARLTEYFIQWQAPAPDCAGPNISPVPH